MKPIIRIAFSSGHVYEVATELVALVQQAKLREELPDQYPTLWAAQEEVKKRFESESAVFDCLLDNFQWADLVPHARLVRYQAPALELMRASLSTLDAPALVGELTGEEMMTAPLELALVAMHASAQLCSVSVLNRPGGEAYGAVIVVQGPPADVSAFVNGAAIITDHVLSKREEAAGQAHPAT